jgi:hypothetical protein
MSTIFAAAASQWRTVRAEYELQREGAYERAETACNGRLLNGRGRRAGIDPYSLFIGPAVRAYAYASEELVDHWARYPRLTFAEFEAQTFDREVS